MSEETNPEEDVSKLREAAAGGAKAKAEAALAKRELAFVKAGIDTDSKPAQALLKGYEGDLDRESIRAEAAEWGLISDGGEPEPEPEPAVETFTEAQAQQELRGDLSGQPATKEQPTKGGVDAALDAFLEDRDDGLSQENATNRAFGRVIQAAAAGDSQALFDQAKWDQEAAKHGHGAEFAR